ncbi:MAG: exodeoxyribonuclease VII large subunit [Clostridiales bacterium]|nr:exodeoxyribonuclease VII large subunit [Clostridiales bacterium]
MAVSELNGYINRQLQFDPILSQVLVVGEISNLKCHSSGHMYFTLKDETSKIQCVMFKSDAETLEYTPADGEKTELTGRVSVYEKEGRYQIYVTGMAPVGKGELYKAFMQLKDSLEEKGYFDKRQPIIPFPSTIGVITSPTGAAIRDILTVLKRRNPYVEVLIYPVRVQGETAKYEISNGIDYFNENPVDTLILARGGGSLEELWAFNELIVAESIFDSKIPIISGVGHETDFTISDFVSDLRAATPTEAAEMAVAPIEQYQIYLDNQKNRLIRVMSQQLSLNKIKLDKSNKNKLCQLVLRDIHDMRSDILMKKNQLVTSYQNDFQNRMNHLEKLGVKLDSVSPLSTLQRGYAVVEKNNKTVESINDVEVSDSIDIILKNGIIRTEVISKERKHLNDGKI